MTAETGALLLGLLIPSVLIVASVSLLWRSALGLVE